jgi:hypothetical protein
VCIAVLEATGRGLTSSTSSIVKLSACRAVNRLIPCLRQLGNGGLECLSSFAAPLLEGLCALMPQAQEDMLHSLFETLLVAVGANAEATVVAESTLTPMLVRIWGDNLADPMVTQYVLDTWSTMVRQSSQCAALVCTQLAPHVCQILSEPPEKLPEGAMESTVDLLAVLVRCGNCDISAPDMSRAFMLVTKLGGADGAADSCADHSVLQNSAVCVRVFVQTMPGQICSLAVGDGVSGLHRCVAMVYWLLSPDVDDSAAMEVGPLISALVRHCGHVLGQVVMEILRAMVGRLRTAHMPSFIQSLLLVLAQLANQQGGQQTIEFLCACGDSEALAFVTRQWLENLPYLMRPYDIKVFAAALGAVCTTRDPRILVLNTEITVESEDSAGGDSIASRTRSARGSQQVTVELTVAVMRGMLRAVGREELYAKERATDSADVYRLH